MSHSAYYNYMLSKQSNTASSSKQQFTNQHNINDHSQESSSNVRTIPHIYGLTESPTSIINDYDIESVTETRPLEIGPSVSNHSSSGVEIGMVGYNPIPQIQPNDCLQEPEFPPLPIPDLFDQPQQIPQLGSAQTIDSEFPPLPMPDLFDQPQQIPQIDQAIEYELPPLPIPDLDEAQRLQIIEQAIQAIQDAESHALFMEEYTREYLNIESYYGFENNEFHMY
ncbi:hypothetical protein BN7_5127 [Wickerhamomyces ciferrii]|uniref:Uncharacterized protein n=1 Tax=Wickerhamomyces ciferrii (strain ATCC 14091 / BCRC 22168 / CBS 111 / JCM 3599 / NBRC 0793 / NRRL Y-1031 F-60-10) TaxID=1206466 RepID=K0KJV8_WICCF|nr:uncharacterized protein BN7_5127 [Wickerhamomyces ciferrii]CCH45545.1 hypothetical protein BN7_5127 [Wickerhamomyces ciferrii]